jgi:hypothetical protein
VGKKYIKSAKNPCNTKKKDYRRTYFLGSFSIVFLAEKERFEHSPTPCIIRGFGSF